MLCLLCFFVMPKAVADDLDKAVKKESKKAKAQLTKEGWQVFGTNKSIKDAMDYHYKVLYGGEGMQTTIEGHGVAKDINLAIRKSQYNASQQYATMQETKVEGQTTTTVSNQSGSKATSSIQMESTFQTSTEQSVKSLTPTVVFYRKMPDGRVEVRSLYVVKAL